MITVDGVGLSFLNLKMTHDVFRKFCIQIQSKKELKILKVRSDHGGEFENAPFEIFCEKHGIVINSLLLELHSKMGL